MCVNGKEDALIKAIISYSPTCLGESLRFAAAISACFNLWVSAMDIVNCFQNTIRSLDDKTHMTLPPYYKEWFRLRHPHIKLPKVLGKLVICLFNACQGNIDAGREWNKLLTKALGALNMHRPMRDLAAYCRKVDGCMAIINVSTDDLLVCADSPMIRTKIEQHFKEFFDITAKYGNNLAYLNYRITQSDAHVALDQTEHISKMTAAYFQKSKVPFKHTGIPFRADRNAEDEIANVRPCTQREKDALDDQYGEHSSACGSINHVPMCSRPDASYSTARLGYFLTVPCSLGCSLLHKEMCYFHSHPNKPLIFPKQPKRSERVLRVQWAANKSEEFAFENALEAFQDAGHSSEKLLRSSYGMDLHAFMGTVCAWKMHRFFVPINSSDSEIKTLFKSVVRVKTFRLLLTSMRLIPAKPTKVYEDNEAVALSTNSHRITPRLRHIDIPLYCTHEEQSKGAFEVVKVGARIQPANMGAKPEVGPALLRNSSICMGHIHVRDMPEDQYAILTSAHPISCYKHFRRENT